MPHKAAIIEHLDEVEDDAAALGAVNCIVADRGRLVGANTDGAGLVASLRADGVEPAGRRALVIGAGGAGRSVARALAPLVEELGIANRSSERRAQALALAGPRGRAAEVAEVAAFDLVINATAVGMGVASAAAALPLDPGLLHADQVVVDLVYDPVETGLLAAARAAGATAVDGVGMLVHQAALAFERWTGTIAPVEAMAEAARTALAAKT
jgi:shikimate dehydrogenase